MAISEQDFRIRHQAVTTLAAPRYLLGSRVCLRGDVWRPALHKLARAPVVLVMSCEVPLPALSSVPRQVVRYDCIAELSQLKLRSGTKRAMLPPARLPFPCVYPYFHLLTSCASRPAQKSTAKCAGAARQLSQRPSPCPKA